MSSTSASWPKDTSLTQQLRTEYLILAAIGLCSVSTFDMSLSLVQSHGPLF